MSQFKFLKIVGKYFTTARYRRVINFFDHYFRKLFKRIDENHMYLAAGGIAYSILLSAIPFVLLVFSILGNIINPETIEIQLKTLIDTVIPYPQYSDYTMQFIMSRITEVIQYKTITAYLGAFGLLFTSTWLFSSMRTTLNGIFKVTENKNAFIALLRDFGMVVLLIILLAFSTFILPVLNVLTNAAEYSNLFKAFQLNELIDVLFSIGSIVILYILFFLFYYLIPYENLGKRVPAVAAFWATLLWELAKTGFGYYVSNFLSSGKLYGAFILIVVIIFWIFYSSILFVLGAEIGQLYRERQQEKKANNDT